MCFRHENANPRDDKALDRRSRFVLEDPAAWLHQLPSRLMRPKQMLVGEDLLIFFDVGHFDFHIKLLI